MRFNSPLRYPGGKGRLLALFKSIFEQNALIGCNYVEPFAGGCGLALSLLFCGYVCRIHINNINRSLYAFWKSILDYTEDMCRLINDTPVNVEEWERQKNIQTREDLSILELGFSTFFLNRTNRSGILSAGIIGGKKQLGKWKIDARYNKNNLIERIKRIASSKGKISVYNMDALDFLKTHKFSSDTLIYLDPPYYIKGQNLYDNFYEAEDHVDLAHFVQQLIPKWIVSYDDVFPIRQLYGNYKSITYNLNYFASSCYKGSEFMVFSHNLKLPRKDVCFI